MTAQLDAQRIYVRLPNWVGDVVLATPFLRALRAAAPAARIVLHGKGHTRKILQGEDFGEFEPLQRQGVTWPVREGRRVAAAHGPFDLALLLPNSFSSALLSRFLGARRRVGYALNGRSWLLTDALFVKKVGRLRPVPMVDYYLGLLEHLGVTPDVARRPQLAVPDDQATWAEAFWARAGLDPLRPVWALNLGGAWLTKRWVPAHASALIERLRGEGVQPLLLWGPGEEDLRDEVLGGVTGPPVAGGDEVVPLEALCAVLRRCQLMVSTDSGPRHFGIAAEIPVLVLIGSTHPGYTQVDYAAYDLLCEEVDCWPCHLKRCPIDFRCMQRLTADKVWGAGQALLARVGQEPAA